MHFATQRGRISSKAAHKRLVKKSRKCATFGEYAFRRLLVRRIESRVESDIACGEIERLYAGACFRRAVHSVHSSVFPFDRQRPLIADVVERDYDFLEINVAVPD